MKIAVSLVACLACANAFTAPAVSSTKSALQMTVWDDYVGGVDFRGGEFKFDPLNIAEQYPPLVPFFRESELRHGRTAMLAVVGYIVADFVRIPGEAYSFAAVPSTSDAHNALIVGPMHQLLLWISLFDIIITAPAIEATMKGERDPGDFGLTKFAPKDKAAFDKKRESELLNGRLAMIAVGGIATQAVLTGHGFPYV